MNRISSFAAATALLLLGTPAFGQNGASAPPSLERRSAALQRDIHLAGRISRPVGRPTEPEGVVEVAFRAGAHGRPEQVVVSRSSGAPSLDRMALRAVGRVRNLHPLPRGIAPNQRFIARILFHRDEATEADKNALLARAAAGDGRPTRQQRSTESATLVRLSRAK